LNLWSTLFIPAHHKSFTGLYTLVDTRVKVQPTQLVNTYPTHSISLFDRDTSQSSITLATFAQFFYKNLCIGQKNVFKSTKWQYNCQKNKSLMQSKWNWNQF
jgi:hypothetical protein